MSPFFGGRVALRRSQDMSQATRLRTDGNVLERALLNSASDDAPAAVARARTLDALGLVSTANTVVPRGGTSAARAPAISESGYWRRSRSGPWGGCLRHSGEPLR